MTDRTIVPGPATHGPWTLTRRAVLGGAAGVSVFAGLPRIAGADPVGDAAESSRTDQGGGGHAMRPVRLTTEYMQNPLGVGAAEPRFGWQLTANGRNRAQSAYRILVSSTTDGLHGGQPDVWDSGRVESTRQSAILYDGPPLESRTCYFWAVRVWDEAGRQGPLSDVAWFETAMLSDDEWTAGWIGSGVVLSRPPRVVGPTFTENIPLEPGHTLGQSFLSEARLAAVAVNLVAGDEPASCVMTLRRAGPAGELLAEETLENLTGEAQGRLDFDEPVDGGQLYVELSEPHGLVQWVTAPDHTYDDGSAYADGEETGDSQARYLDGIPPDPPPDPVLRTEFELPAERGDVRSARLYIAGLGHAVTWINGERVGDAELDPPCTDFDLRVLYTTHDVTSLIRHGGNAIGVALGRGFFGTRAVDSDGAHLSSWIAEPQVKAELEVAFADGSRETIGTGTGWRLAEGPTVYDGVYTGETYDARRAEEIEGWSEPGFDDGDWQPAVSVEDPGGVLEAYVHEPTRADEPVEPVEVTRLDDGTRLYDFGVVLAGWVKLRGDLPTSTTVRMLHAEKLGPSGRIEVGTPGGTQNHSVVGRLQLDEYIAAGGREESWHPSFTYKGFRYLEVSGTDRPLDIVAVPVFSDVPHAAELDLEQPELRWIVEAFFRTAGNALHGLPDPSPAGTKFGWTGNAHFASQPMLYAFGMAGLFGKWLDDIRLSQAEDGQIPTVTPVGRHWPKGLSPTWTGVYPHLVYRYWLAYGDKTVPAKHFDAVAQYVEWVSAVADEDYFDDNFGDWLPPGRIRPGGDGNRLVGMAYVIKSLREGTALAELLGYDEEAAAWRERTDRLIARFNDEFLDAGAGLYHAEMDEEGYQQTSNAIPLAFGFVPPEHIDAVAANLAAAVEQAGRLDTGCAGIAALPYALTDQAGRPDLTHLVLTQTEYPSYGYLRDLGATTFWESWEPDSRGHHDTLWSSPVQWLVERVFGVETVEPGWARFRVAPRASGTLPGAELTLDTVRGRIGVTWQRDGDTAVLRIRVPVNTVAEVELPNGEQHELGSGRHRLPMPLTITTS
ncbi:alpha-L-rhamnosidase [Phytoactinopolyspora endophytica]|uniref:alpha-L-rhamnosidase n=1 Tax=Phytoactinopolyspora endophytica TaxID=1642495 RepID=UPI00197C3229|nr:alpha-L-rhamnosidase [Phytoactinopolyspora endophytica]